MLYSLLPEKCTVACCYYTRAGAHDSWTIPAAAAICTLFRMTHTLHELNERSHGLPLLPPASPPGELHACAWCPQACCRLCCRTRLRCRATIFLAVAVAVAVLLTAYFNSFWLLPPLVKLPRASVRLRSIGFSPFPPALSVFLSLNISITNRIALSLTIQSATARVMYLDGAQVAAGSSSPSEYFVATGSMSGPPVPVPAYARDVIIPVDVVALGPPATPAALALLIRDCTLLPRPGSGLYLRFYLSGV